MILETQRLKLKILTEADIKAYFNLSQNDGFIKFQISNYRMSSLEESQKWIKNIENYHSRNGLGILGVFDKHDNILIGLCALKYLETEKKSQWS